MEGFSQVPGAQPESDAKLTPDPADIDRAASAEGTKEDKDAELLKDVKGWAGGEVLENGDERGVTGVFYDLSDGTRIGRSHDREEVYVAYERPGVQDRDWVNFEATPEKLALIDSVIPVDAW